jgi:hypothetical protein
MTNRLRKTRARGWVGEGSHSHMDSKPTDSQTEQAKEKDQMSGMEVNQMSK